MKIKRDKINSFNTPGQVGIKGTKQGANSSFEHELFEHREKESQLRMQEALKEIDRFNEKLKRSLTVYDLMLYKKIVKRFLAEATTRAYAIKQERGRTRRGRSLLIAVATIDAEVEQMIADFISQRKEPIEVLATLDKIRGMLVDLMA